MYRIKGRSENWELRIIFGLKRKEAGHSSRAV
jgi:hypothetical protein